MQSKIVWLILVVITLVFGYLYFLFNPSYQQSIESRIYYELGNYKKAYTLADASYKAEPYNKMAFTVRTQSLVALKFVDFIEEAKGYMKKINAIAAKNKLEDADRIRIKFMAEIIIEKYPTIQPTVLTDEELIQEAKILYEKFVELHEKVVDAL